MMARLRWVVLYLGPPPKLLRAFAVLELPSRQWAAIVVVVAATELVTSRFASPPLCAPPLLGSDLEPQLCGLVARFVDIAQLQDGLGCLDRFDLAKVAAEPQLDLESVVDVELGLLKFAEGVGRAHFGWAELAGPVDLELIVAAEQALLQAKHSNRSAVIAAYAPQYLT